MTASETALAAAAAALVVEHDMVGTLTRLCVDCADVVGAAAAGIMLADGRGPLEVLVASSHKAEEIDVYEIQADQGPCIDAYRTGSSISCASPDEIMARWPDFGPQAAAAGFQAVQACPLRWRGLALGALNVFIGAPGSLTDAQRQVVQAFADIATIAVIQARPPDRDLAGVTHHALATRAVIEQGKGVVAAQSGLSMAAAFDRLRVLADARGIPLEKLAREIIDAGHR